MGTVPHLGRTQVILLTGARVSQAYGRESRRVASASSLEYPGVARVREIHPPPTPCHLRQVPEAASGELALPSRSAAIQKAGPGQNSRTGPHSTTAGK